MSDADATLPPLRFSDYLVFVDESGDHSLTSIDSTYPVFVLAFCVIHKDEYLTALVPAMKALKHREFGHDEIVLHEADLRRKKGAFSQLNLPRRDAFMSHLSGIIDRTDFTLITVVIDKVAHKAKYVQPEHPYYLSLQYGLERVFDFLRIKGAHDRETVVICECRGPNEDKELELQFRRICDKSNRGNLVYPLRLVMTDKRANSEGLQLADLVARPVGISVLRPGQANRAFEVAKKKFFTGRHGVIEGNGLKIFPR